jgi:F-type H+-transporting ATPase subunit b
MAADTVQPTQASTAPADSGAGGLPQFDLAQWPGQMVWMLIIFGVLFILFARVFVPKVGGAIADREDRISGDFGAARKLKDEADALAAAAAAEMEQARAAAQKLAVDAKTAARADAAKREALEEAKIAETLAKSEAMLASAREAAMSHVRGIAEDAAGLIISKLTGAAASADEIKSAATGA